MAVRGMVFDIGDVLEYTPDLRVREHWEARLGLPTGALDRRLGDVWLEGCYGRVTEAEVLSSMVERLGIDRPTAEAFQADLWREYLGVPNEELLQYCRALRSRHPTGILSNSFVGARAREQQHIGVGELADVIVYSHEVGFLKPEPEIYLLTCERLGLPPEQVAFLDDNPSYLEGAAVVGMHAIRFVDNGSAIEAIESWLGPAADRGQDT